MLVWHLYQRWPGLKVGSLHATNVILRAIDFLLEGLDAILEVTDEVMEVRVVVTKCQVFQEIEDLEETRETIGKRNFYFSISPLDGNH